MYFMLSMCMPMPRLLIIDVGMGSSSIHAIVKIIERRIDACKLQCVRDKLEVCAGPARHAPDNYNQ